MFAGSYFGKRYFTGVYFPPVQVDERGGTSNRTKRNRHLEAIIRDDNEILEILSIILTGGLLR